MQEVQSASQDLERSRVAYEQRLAIDPQDAAAQSGEVQVSERIALNVRAAGDRDGALAALLRAKPFAPDSVRLLYDLGVLEDEMQLYRDAERVLSHALELEGNVVDDPNLLYAVGRVKLDLGDLSAAEEEMTAYLKLRPADASAHYALGRIYLQGLRYIPAATEFQRSVELQPAQTEAYFELGETFLKQGQYEEAIKNYSVTLQRNPQHAGALVGVGTAYFKQKLYSTAVVPLRKAVEADPGYSAGHYYLGLTLARLGDTEGSHRELETATALAEKENKQGASRLQLLNPEGHP